MILRFALLASMPGGAEVPAGSDADSVQRYYRWLYQHYLDRIAASPTQGWSLSRRPPWEIAWAGPFLQMLSVGLVLTGVFWVFAWFFNHPRRHRPMLYRPSTFGGVITERHGKLGPFNIILSLAVIAWAVYYPVSHVLFGQIY